MRLLLLVLVLANGIYFAWSHGGLAAFGFAPASLAEREPQRMSQQIRPQALVIRNDAKASPAPSESPSGSAPARSAP
ncbi:sporulation protein [Variovorax dokdonensis]|uniref:Sporulation protein n=1 Tax=Variovorax dokdonensis TaxID=344883 RepID=A0ABT7N9R3_9BURK|nr:sporulation protein [Variovorax dokdonensis]MDM0044600.1 sporulation protein [Variovorax dokdonensis]